MINIGTHVSSSKSLDLVFDRGREVRAQSIQFFLRSPRSWTSVERKEEEKELFVKKSRTYNISPKVAHASYLYNLASPDENLFNKSLNGVIQDLKLCEEIGIDYYVIHAGKTKGESKESGVERIKKAFEKIFRDIPLKRCCFLVETLAGQRGEVGESIHEIKQLIEPFEGVNIGVCIDTAHLFASGYRIDRENGLLEYKEVFDNLIGLEKIKLIHCNDSKVPFGSKKDRHEHIGKGFIRLEGFRVIVNDKLFRTLPFILETPKEGNMDIINIQKLRELEHP
ncbi:MAG: deoxyribonuclease IV [Hydrogenothermaceae bacterium]|nr:deoxyribonuclease IV [Hydrogenothermaceae bacterium]